MDQPKIERLLSLMKLLTSNVNYTIEDLAERLNMSDRSVYRYISTFKDAGFIVVKNGDCFSLSVESKYFKDISQLVHFTEEEAYIFNSLLDCIDGNNVLKENLRRKLASIYNYSNIADCVVSKKSSSIVHSLLEAMQGHKQARLINYYSSHNDTINDREIEPFGFTTNYNHVWCFDLKDGQNKLFKTLRIGSVEVSEREWQHEDEHKEGYIDIFRMSGYEQHNVKLLLGVMSYNLLLEEYPLAKRDLKSVGENRWLLDTMVTSFYGIGRFYLGLADNITIIDSPGFKEHIFKFVKHNFKKN